MATTNTAQTPAVDPLSSDELTAKAAQKRYEGLVMVRNKAIKGKGAWYWAHLEPMLINNADTGLPKAVKLRCSLCDAIFSASNPSRTASEHLKRGTCPNSNSLAKPISSISPSSSNLASPSGPNRKRSSSSSMVEVSKSVGVSGGGIGVGFGVGSSSSSYQATPLAMVDPSRFQELASTAVTASVDVGSFVTHQHTVLSGGKEDLGALAMLEYSVKKLKSLKTSPGPTLSKNQIDTALDFLADWIYESCGSVSFSSMEHPKFKAFLNQVGLPAFSRREFVGSRLDLKFEEVKAESEARIRDAMFFQVSSDGWKVKGFGEENLVNLTINLPNGTSLYRRAVFVSSSVPSKYAEEILWETIIGICGNVVQQCVGIVADKFKDKALRNLENQHHWMVNLSCQFQGFTSLIKDFKKELPIFKTAAENCFKLANFVNNSAQIRNSFCKYQLQEYGHSGLLRVPLREYEKLDNFEPLNALLEDILNSAGAFKLLLSDESYNMLSLENPLAREVAEMILEVGFWNELEAVHSLVKLIKEMAQEIETERPLVGQCLPLWNDLRAKVKGWCSKFHMEEAPVEKVIERRFKKNYHPAWAAAFILDPLYLIRDTSGKYLPPFKCLTPEQEKDVDKLITRLVSREEAHIALMELMKWRTEGLDSVYAQAVQMKERDPITGKMKIANPQSSRLVWETHLTEFKSLGKVAVRLIFLHATSCGFKCNLSLLRWVSRAGIERAQKLIFIAAHSKLERRDFSSDEEKDARLFGLANGEDDVLNEVLVDTSSL
ncbi:uncharacterized protein LOC123204204 [Mangifera indica]|uniref:uncharacterized protein LOC123204204 n=1 Tax=Mangifera indica TaxID=29780 RepID=UPI001CF99BBC|nr:uncharacterized protein LOC123204204 [Mangifera indica]